MGKPAGLMIEVEKDEPMGGKGDKPPPSSRSPDEDLGEFDAALDDAFEATKSGDKAAFRDAMGAAISAKCAEMYGDDDQGDD